MSVTIDVIIDVNINININSHHCSKRKTQNTTTNWKKRLFNVAVIPFDVEEIE